MPSARWGPAPSSLRELGSSGTFELRLPVNRLLTVVAADQTFELLLAGEIVAQFTPALGEAEGEPTGQRAWGQNPFDRVDVDGDGVRTPLDALLVINYLNSRGPAALAAWGAAAGSLTAHWDTNGDGAVTAADVLMVVNALNAPRSAAQRGGGEGEGGPALASAAPAEASLGTPRSFGLDVRAAGGGPSRFEASRPTGGGQSGSAGSDSMAH